MDDNTDDGSPDTPRKSAPESPADLRRTHCCMEYPGIRSVKSHYPSTPSAEEKAPFISLYTTPFSVSSSSGLFNS